MASPKSTAGANAPTVRNPERKKGFLALLFSLIAVLVIAVALYFVIPQLMNMTRSNSADIEIPPLEILSQPKDTGAPTGELATLYLVASGQDLTYEWWISEPDLYDFKKTDQASNVFFLEMSEENTGSSVYCIVTDAEDNALTSDTVTLRATDELQILQQPADVYARTGEQAVVSVEAAGIGLSYQWWFADAGKTEFSKSDFTVSTYSIPMEESRDGRRLYCVITDAEGNSLTTDIATIYYDYPIRIIKQPQDATAGSGEHATVSVEAKGEGLSYQWWFADAGKTEFSKSDFTSDTYSIPMEESLDGRRLYCVISDTEGNTVTTDTVTIYFDFPIRITKQPQSATAGTGERINVSVAAEGDGLTYQWWYADAGKTEFSKSDFTVATYSIPMEESRDGRRLYCVITDKEGNTVTTDTVTIYFDFPIRITAQPKDATAKSGENVTVSVTAEGEGLTYQWWYADAGKTEFSRSEFTSSKYTVPMVEARDGRRLYCVITDAEGNTVTTETATIHLAD